MPFLNGSPDHLGVYAVQKGQCLGGIPDPRLNQESKSPTCRVDENVFGELLIKEKE